MLTCEERTRKEQTMSRPDFPRPYTPLTPGMISRIRSEQDHYDQNPERAERQQREREEERQREEQEMQEQERRYYEDQ